MTDREELQEKIEAVLQAMRDIRLDFQGGYPAQIDSTTIPGYVIIADVDHDDAPFSDIYKWEDLYRWHELATAFLEEYPNGYTLTDAFFETEGDLDTDE